jgi:hypothetical protein
LRADGTIANEPGYDKKTRVVVSPRVSGSVQMTVMEARWLIDEMIADFPFASESHKGAFVCAMLTPLALYAFEGPAPLFLFEASTPGSGKSLLAQLAALVGMGRIPSPMQFAESDEEMRKKITALAQNPKPVVLLDNITMGVELGGAALCAAISSSDRTWSDRLLGGNVQFEGKINSVWYATGNNTSIGPDMHRRVCPVRLEPHVERPEDRSSFRHPDLIGWTKENAHYLTWACLTILRDRKPWTPRKAWGSFVGWQNTVVGAAVGAGYESPDAAVELLRSSSDSQSEGTAFVLGWAELCEGAEGGGLTTDEAIARLYPSGFAGMGPKSALRVFLDGKYPKGCSGKQLGYLLRSYRGCVFSGIELTQDGFGHNHARKWVVKNR